jgi:hypothetical protein
VVGQGLTHGQDFGSAIDRHLADARAVLCLWTPSSIASQWVRAEAAKANTAGKLVPVKTSSVTYEQIPPPFNVLDTGDVEQTARIVDAVTALLARPAVKPGRWFLARARTRQEVLAWFGIAGAVLTVSANLRGLLDLARWADWLLTNWLDVIAWFWKTVLFFAPRLTVDDASLLAILLFLLMNVAACVRRGHARNSLWTAGGSVVLGALIVGSIYWSAFDRIMSDSAGMTGQVFDWLWVSFIAPMVGVDTTNGIYPEDSHPLVLATSVAVLAAGLTGILLVARAILRLSNAYIDTNLLFGRLMRIAAGVLLLMILSAAYKRLESLAFR